MHIMFGQDAGAGLAQHGETALMGKWIAGDLMRVGRYDQPAEPPCRCERGAALQHRKLDPLRVAMQNIQVFDAMRRH